MSESNGKITRDDIRAKLLRSRTRNSKTYVTEDGIEIEIRQPTVGQRGRMLKAAGVGTGGTDIQDITAMQVAAVVECAYVPGGENLFSWEDEEVLRELPTSSWFDEVATIAMEVMNVEAPEAGKPSSETKSDSTSSSSQKNLAAP